jgi:hypothetical protein
MYKEERTAEFLTSTYSSINLRAKADFVVSGSEVRDDNLYGVNQFSFKAIQRTVNLVYVTESSVNFAVYLVVRHEPHGAMVQKPDPYSHT